MSVSGDNDTDASLSASSNFWEIKQYARAVKRVDNSYKLCSELSALIHERAEIEKMYSTSLKKWAGKWQAFLDTNVEYGTTQYCWRAFCKEAESISNIHNDIRSRLVDDASVSVKNWQRDHFRKSALPPQSLKESKQLEGEFEVAQKPWAKRYKKVQQCKKDYHNAVKMVRSYNNQIQAITTDPSNASDQLRKLQDKLKKAEKDEEKTKHAYESSLEDLEKDNSRYIEDMTDVFTKAQQFERDRLEFFKSVFYSLQAILNISSLTELPESYRSLHESIDQVAVEADLNWWSEMYGADMPIVLPAFEEYNPELQNITKRKGTGVADSGVTLTGVSSAANDHTSRQSSFRAGGAPSKDSSQGHNGASSSAATTPAASTTTPETSTAPHSADRDSHHGVKYDETLNPFSMEDNGHHIMPNPQNPFGDDPDMDNTLVDDGRPGVKVRALYDYEGAEEDELTFNTGDIFEKLEDEDEQGWCKGRKNDRVGLYPANYVEVI